MLIEKQKGKIKMKIKEIKDLPFKYEADLDWFNGLNSTPRCSYCAEDVHLRNFWIYDNAVLCSEGCWGKYKTLLEGNK